ncbi:hypothetical protein P171DRAFT_488543 [Karstenula rhodostoma CBS 690.94]|uniref:Uncharacterized protein n=1 Tax=Karstenula rhodostoma CBS 690.94 TaxID=1392251 RepID=A0A9P4P9N2_9PLEO|nr:hypothetical protein P171DRAFT_488543 [Karstenula rhodostoma CBS 690.94]
MGRGGYDTSLQAKGPMGPPPPPPPPPPPAPRKEGDPPSPKGEKKAEKEEKKDEDGEKKILTCKQLRPPSPSPSPATTARCTASHLNCTITTQCRSMHAPVLLGMAHV